jgi:hypothetical protein
MKYVLVLALILALVVAARRPAGKRALLFVLGLAALYAILKATGVIEAIAPDRFGVF